jgi:hypothetical protein
LPLSLMFPSSYVHPSTSLVSFCISVCSTSYIFIRFCVPVEFFSFLFFPIFTSSFSYVFSSSLFSSYSLSFPSAFVVCLSVSGSVRKPQFVKPTPPALFAVFSLSSGCAAVKAASGRAHVPYHGRRSVSIYVANLDSARSGPICYE